MRGKKTAKADVVADDSTEKEVEKRKETTQQDPTKNQDRWRTDPVFGRKTKGHAPPVRHICAYPRAPSYGRREGASYWGTGHCPRGRRDATFHSQAYRGDKWLQQGCEWRAHTDMCTQNGSLKNALFQLNVSMGCFILLESEHFYNGHTVRTYYLRLNPTGW